VRDWAKDNAREVERWLATQPEGARTTQLRAHVARAASDPRRN
jgi:hypothetical protein